MRGWWSVRVTKVGGWVSALPAHLPELAACRATALDHQQTSGLAGMNHVLSHMAREQKFGYGIKDIFDSCETFLMGAVLIFKPLPLQTLTPLQQPCRSRAQWL